MNPKKKNKRILDRVISVLLTACIMLTTFSAPISAFAETVDSVSSDISSSEVGVISGDAVEVTEDESSSDASSDSSSDSSSSEDTSTSDFEADSENGVADSSNSDSVSETESTESDSSSSESDDTSSTGESSSSDSEASSSSVESSSSEGTDSDSSDNSSSDSSSSEEQADSSSSSDESSSDSEESSSATEDDASSDVDSESQGAESTETNSENTESEEENIEEEFVAVGIIAPETDVITAEIGSEVTFTSKVNRDDVEVTYQWQRIQNEPIGITSSNAIYDYSDGAPTRYSFVLDDTTESEYLENYPDATWRGIEMYYAIMGALDEIGEDCSNISIEWNTQNYILDGYTISATRVGDHVEIYAEKDGQRHVGTLNSEGKWSFGDAQEVVNSWEDIEGATSDTYTFTVGYNDYSFLYRCVVTVTDEEYKEACRAILEEQGVTLTEEQLAAEQKLYSPSMTLKSNQLVEDVIISTFAANEGTITGNPQLSDDVQWITGLTTSYEYITKDTYDRISAWVNAASGEERTKRQELADRCWTRVLNGFGQATYAPVFDKDSLPTGDLRLYAGFTLTDGMLEVNSNWYGKTVYFRVHSKGQEWSDTGTAIDVPAYTELTKDAEGNYIEAASGTRYKKAITLLNPYVLDTGSKYQEYLELGAISTSASYSKGKGWLLNDSGNVTDNHITVYAVSCEKFNEDPQKFMVDAEGNYRMDSVAWGVCAYEEPDISGKVYWVLKDYIANGYGFLVGHDTMYAYAGAYYDAFGIDLDESTIDPNDGTTWYYDINSWMPGTTATTYNRDSAGNIVSVAGRSASRGGHFYLNELMGSNAGSVDSGTVQPSDAPGSILSGGGSHGIHGKKMMYGGTSLKVVQTGFTAAQALSNAKYRTPTNYPFAFTTGQTFSSSETHTNQQIAFGTVWVNYAQNTVADLYGTYKDEKIFNIGKSAGTSNFYLTGVGNFLMNQIGHLPSNSATLGEAKLFANSVFYVSQRKQCEICAANQDGQQTVHFVHRITSANADEILGVLSEGGNYWYPLNDCYMLTDDITLPEDWIPIKNFSGHWNSDVYDVKLNSAGTPLLENTETPAEKYNTGSGAGWNLGADQSAGVENVFKTDGSGTRTTGVARVLGDLNDLFETNTSYAGYVVKILGSDNLKYLPADAEYACTVNTDSKYIISNLPCIYDSSSHTGILKARVYDANGTEVTKYGIIRTNVQNEFWDNDMTTPLYLADFTAFPIPNVETYEWQGAAFVEGGVYWHEKVENVQWQVLGESGKWVNIETVTDLQGHYVIGEPVFHENEESSYTSVSLTLNDCSTDWDGWHFRAVFTNNGKTVDTYSAGIAGKYGKLTVNPWAMKLTQAYNQEVWVGETATFTSTAEYLAGIDTGLKVEWEFMSDRLYGSWQPVENAGIIVGNDGVSTSSIKKSNSVYEKIIDEFKFEDIETYKTTSVLTIPNCGTELTGYCFRVHYSYTDNAGKVHNWYSSFADNVEYRWKGNVSAYEAEIGEKEENREGVLVVNPANISVVLQKAADEDASKNYVDDITPDEYGQKAFLEDAKDYSTDTVTYTAIIYYCPDETSMTITPRWEYVTYLDETVREWNDAVAKSIYSDMKVTITNTSLTVAGEKYPEDGKYYDERYDGWSVMKSVMTITNISGDMYDSSAMMKYFFRCTADGTIKTNEGTIKETGSSVYGGLVLDYNMLLQHMGVQTYVSKNIINGDEVTNMAGISIATDGHTYSVWQYPNLRIETPKEVNSVIVQFNSTGYDSRDYISYDASIADKIGVKAGGSNTSWTFIAKERNTVSLPEWEELLRTMQFVTYDEINISSSGVTGGVDILWYADENVFPEAVNYSEETGHYYSVIASESALSWEQAKSLAQALYNPSTDSFGYLAHITSAAENTYITSLLNGNTAWIGASKANGTNYWYWKGGADAPDSETSAPFAQQASKLFWGLNKFPSITSSLSGAYNASINTDGSWNAVKGATYNYYVVEWSPEEIHEYQSFYNSSKLTWSQARNLAKQKWNNNTRSYGYLAHITSSAENNYIKEIAQTASWIGGSISNGNWYWYDGCASETSSPFAKQGSSVYWGFYNHKEGISSGSDYNGRVFAIYSGGGTWDTEGSSSASYYGYIVEWHGEKASQGLTASNHSVIDTDTIGTQASIPVALKITVKVDDSSKIYDGKELMPTIEVTATGNVSNPASFIEAKYTCHTPSAEYTETILSASAKSGNKVINAGSYTVVLSLTDKAKEMGYTLTADSDTSGTLTVYKRPINLYSLDNDKIYDGNENITVKDIKIEAVTDDSGVVSGDKVTLTTNTVEGVYVKGEDETIHTGEDMKIIRKSGIALDSNPYSNYYIANENYEGSINPRPLYVHSLYQDTDKENNPRNIKEYDGTSDAVVKDIIIDNIVEGDVVWVNADSYKGHYTDEKAEETLNSDGSVQTDRFNNLIEKKITVSDEVKLINNYYGDYYIAEEKYSGAIYRATLDARVRSWRGIYGDGLSASPWHDTEPYKAGIPATSGCWLSISGLIQGEEITLDYAKSNFKVKNVADGKMTVTASTPVGVYGLTYEGLTETNYDILKNYVVSMYDGSLTVEPREIVIQVNDGDKMVGEENPPFYSTFYVRADDDTLAEVGSDETSEYADMKLVVDTDTVANSILVRPHGEDTTTLLSKVDGVSNISYITDCTKDSPVQYLNLNDLANQPTEPCEWCENYHGFELGTDHWKIAGYEVKINHDSAVASTLEVAYVTNPLGEQVQNYTLSYVSGALLVHPELRFQLKATVPMVVCMYGYNGDGEVVEPTNYGITNYSNGAIKVTDIEVSNDGWILAPDASNLKAGEMYMKMNDTVLGLGHNEPRNPFNWVATKGDVDKGEGSFLNLPLTCYIAGGNVNEAVETYVTQVTYTIAEHGTTLPEINN